MKSAKSQVIFSLLAVGFHTNLQTQNLRRRESTTRQIGFFRPKIVAHFRRHLLPQNPPIYQTKHSRSKTNLRILSSADREHI